MILMAKNSDYETPEIQLLRVEVESPILTGSNPTITNPDMDWELYD